MLNLMFATYRKNRIAIKRALPVSFFLSRVFGGVFAIIFPYFVYHYFLRGSLSPEFAAYANGADYLTYIVLGAALNVLAVATLMNIGRALITEMREGTLEIFLISPASRGGYFLGCLLEQTSRALLEFAVVLLAGRLLGAKLTHLLTWEALLAIFLAMFSFFCLGLTLSAIMLRTRDTYISQNTLFTTMTLLCGVMYPLEYLPLPLQKLAQIFPLTPAAALFRAVVIQGRALADNLGLLLQICLLCLIYALVGLVWFRKLERTLVERLFS